MDPDVYFLSTCVHVQRYRRIYILSRLNDADVDKAFQDGSACRYLEQRKGHLLFVIEKKLLVRRYNHNPHL